MESVLVTSPIRGVGETIFMTVIHPIQFQGKIHLILNNQDLAVAFQGLNNVLELGFDTETRPSYLKGQVYKVALLQLATNSEAYLVRLHAITDFSPIKKVFEDKKILKVGVAIRDDLKGLQKIFSFNPENFIELQDVAKKKGLNHFGLKGMAEEVLQARLSKGPKLTNWEASRLTEIQVKYAATDAWIGLQLYKTITHSDFVAKSNAREDKS